MLTGPLEGGGEPGSRMRWRWLTGRPVIDVGNQSVRCYGAGMLAPVDASAALVQDEELEGAAGVGAPPGWAVGDRG